jgi:hypothetical protein
MVFYYDFNALRGTRPRIFSRRLFLGRELSSKAAGVIYDKLKIENGEEVTKGKGRVYLGK